MKSNLIPTVTFHIYISEHCDLCIFHDGDVHVGVKDSAIQATSAVSQVMEIGIFVREKLDRVMHVFINIDGGR